MRQLDSSYNGREYVVNFNTTAKCDSLYIYNSTAQDMVAKGKEN